MMSRISWGNCLTAALFATLLSSLCFGQTESKSKTPDSIPSGIAWYGVLTDGIAEAKATNRPIMILSAAPQCAGVPGMW